MLLLDTATDPLSGAGWVGAGLLGAVLSWLMFIHLPAKDKQLTDLINRHIAAEKEQRDQFRELLLSFMDRSEKNVQVVKTELVALRETLRDTLGNRTAYENQLRKSDDPTA